MVLLLQKFRLDIHDVIVMTDSERPPNAKNLKRFEDVIAPFRLREGQHGEAALPQLKRDCPWKVSDKELEALRLKSERKVRLNEIIRKNSQNAALVLVTLPVPQTDCPSALYMAWLDTLSSGLHCPTLLIRGNQCNVLTFYCQTSDCSYSGGSIRERWINTAGAEHCAVSAVSCFCILRHSHRMEEGEENMEYGWKRRQSVRMLRGMLKRVGPFRPDQIEGAEESKATPPKHDLIRIPLREWKENGHIKVNGSTSSGLKSTNSKDCASWDDKEYPVYENIFLIGEEKCVEDWPEDSPELHPDWKPAGRLRLRRESMKILMETPVEWGNEDPMENSQENNSKARKSRRFTLPSRRESKIEAELSEKGADLLREVEGEENESDVADECKKTKRGKKFKLAFLQRRDSKAAELPETPPGATCRNYHLSEAAEIEAELSEKGADLLREVEGEEDESDVADE
ncbi:hypothetical protein COCON_G00113210 [Conger conger]|uniref:SLC12A transporter C-terminal domain-containing protein n=1 Tax=Conger conger TaxID=82655 RepID=A0A9Q1DFK8_CONCO|nr:hypothetical protein COCON_G00113210 [Conger conger]